MDWDKENNKYFGEIFKQINSKFLRCFWPKESCSERAIKAHSIQNSKVLDLLCENDHVIMPRGGVNIDTGLFLKFEEVSRNKATTFTGMCNNHDNKLFEPIDKNHFDSNNNEHLFLITYRSVLRELHANMKRAVDIQSQYTRGVELGRLNADIPDQPRMMATMCMAEAYSFYLYKFQFDQIYIKGNYSQIAHQIEFIENIEPSIAVSSSFSFIDNMRILQDRHDPKCISLNIFPCDNGIYIIFSYRKDQEANLLPYVEKILQAEKYYKLYLISKLVLMYCENFVVSPKFYRNLPESNKKSITNFFMNNIWGEKKDCENSELYLFN